MINREILTIGDQENNDPVSPEEIHGTYGVDSVHESDITEKSIEQIKKIVLEKINRKFEETKDFGVYESVANFVREMEEKYSSEELRKCKLFHAITGSTISPENHVPNIDLPGGEIKEFIMNL